MWELVLFSPTVLAAAALCWLMINPAQDPATVAGTRRLFAKRIARVVFWCVFGPAVVLLAGFWADPVNRDEWGHVGWAFNICVVPLSVWPALMVCGLLRVANESADAALLAPPALRSYRMRFLSGWSLGAYAVLILLVAAAAWGVGGSPGP